MGIRNLTSFFTLYKREFFVPYDLYNCEVVIDGSNLFFMLFVWCPNNNGALGGDYDKYYQYVTSFFKRLEVCKINSTVFLDGAYDPANLEFSTKLKRARDQNKSSIYAKPFDGNKNMLSPFCRDIFVYVCHQFKVKVYQTDFESDFCISQFSKKFNTPIISNDSDFFLSDVEIIPLDSISFEVSVCANGTSYLSSRKFVREKFMSCYNIKNIKHLYLMASVLGNNCVKLKEFNAFFAQISMPKKKNMCHHHKIIEGFLKWLGKEKTVDDCIERMLKTFPKDQRDNIKIKIHNSMARYIDSENSIFLEFFSELNELFSPKTFNNQKAPKDLIKEFRNGIYSNWICDVLYNRQALLKTLIEDKLEISSHFFAPNIVQNICHILTSVDEDYPKEIKIYSRIKKDYDCQNIIICGPPAYQISDLRKMPLKDRKTYFFRFLEFPSDIIKALEKEDDFNLKLFLAGIHCWTSNSKFTSILKIQSIIFAIFLHSRLNLSDSKVKVSSENFKKIFRLFKTEKKVTTNNSTIFIHSSSNLQCIIIHIRELALLLKVEEYSSNVWKLWNGTLMYNLYVDLLSSRKVNPIHYLLDFRKDLISEYNEFFNYSLSFTSNLCFESII